MPRKQLVTVLIFTMGLLFLWGWHAQARDGASILEHNASNSTVLDPSWEINVRRDTSNGLPYGSTHSSGISSIVWGNVFPQTAITVTLTRSGTPVITQQVISDQWGDFTISVDRLIEDGDDVQVASAGSEKTVAVPVMTYQADPVSRVITGIAPAGITSIVPGSPHSLSMTLAGVTRQITTSATGEFSVDFSDLNYLAGLIGTMRYTTPASDNVYKPVRVVDPLTRGEYNDGWADIILGQPDFGEIVFNDVVDHHLFNPQGVYIDRSVEPNRLYVYDGGNSRVLGLSALGTCQGGSQAGEDCTTDTDCPGSVCQIESDRAADLLLGQPEWNSAACNGDSGFQYYPDVALASADSLCGLREEQMSVSEGGSGVTMVTDGDGNLYLPDFFNNRILRYDDPFGTDGIADYVWGQADFQGIFCNRGMGFSRPSAESLCLAPPPGIGELRAGVAVDPEGNLWVTDAWNNRVLRYSQDGTGIPATEADLVLGQADFNTASDGSGLNQMHNPASIQITSGGTVYVADSLNNRVLVFEPPFSNGMAATRVISGILNRPTGLGLDPSDGLWVNDNGNNRFIHYVGEVAQEIINSVDEEGGLGVDGDGNVFSAGSGAQSVIRFTAPGYPRANEILQGEPGGIFNSTTSRSLYGGHGLEIAAGQLIHSDESRLLFWNDLQNLQNHQPADGVIGAPDFETRERWGQRFQRMRADQNGRLWVIYKDASSITSILSYQLPLETGEDPVQQISAPLPLLGGGELSWSSDFFLWGIDVQAECDCLWVTDEGYHRAFRIRNASTTPVVDIVLGQLDISETGCNQGRGRDFPSQDSLCHPGALALDNDGNLYIADHNLEFDGNLRLLEWDADQLPTNPTSVVFGIPASRVFGRNNDFTEPNCLSGWQDPLCAPWEPAFDSQGRVVIGFNGYLGSRFPLVYQDLLNNPYPIAALGDFHSMPVSARFDEDDNLYVVDHNRSRILIYKREVIQAYSISGQVEGAVGEPIVGVNVVAIGNDTALTVTTSITGSYLLPDLISGTYAIRPVSNLYAFSPEEQAVTLPPSADGVDFVAVPLSYTLSGRVENAVGEPIVGVNVVAIGNDTALTATTSITGSYLLPDLISGTYTIRPESVQYSFSPVERSVTVPPSAEGLDFVAIPIKQGFMLYLPLVYNPFPADFLNLSLPKTW